MGSAPPLQRIYHCFTGFLPFFAIVTELLRLPGLIWHREVGLQRAGQESLRAEGARQDQTSKEFRLLSWVLTSSAAQLESQTIVSGPPPARKSKAPPTTLKNPLQLVQKEIAILKKLSHPNVVKLVEVRWAGTLALGVVFWQKLKGFCSPLLAFLHFPFHITVRIFSNNF